MKSTVVPLLCCLLLCCSVMKAQTVFRGVVLDAVTKKPIPAAKVGVTNQGVGEITSSKGRFIYRKYHQIIDDSNRLEVSATSYQSLEMPSEELRTILHKNSTIYLQPLTIVENKPVASPRKVHVLWDASKVTKFRNPKNELDFRLRYLNRAHIDTVRLTIFNEKLLFDTLLSVQNQIEEIENKIELVEYGGVSNYHFIPSTSAQAVLLFSEHLPTYGELMVNQHIPVHTISSNLNHVNETYFKSMSAYTSGQTINLNQFSSSAAAKFLVSGKFPPIETVVSSEQIITGTIRSSTGPIHFATISREGSLDEIYSEVDGTFEVPASKGDRFKVMYLGKFTAYFTVSDETEYTIYMEDSSEVLEEVEITAKRNRYNFNPNKNTELFEGRAVPVRSLHISEMNTNVTNTASLINGKFGVISTPHYTYVKGLEAEWVVDGVVMSPSQVSPKNIIRISVFRPETNLVGLKLARPRAKIIVTTKFHKDHLDAEYRRMGFSPRDNNLYTETPTLLSFDITTGNYAKPLVEIANPVRKWEEYQKLRAQHKDKVDFYVAMSLYFQDIDPEWAKKVRSDFAVVAQHNLKTLRVLAYLHEIAGANSEAQYVYERVLTMAPDQPASYRDLAYIYSETGAYQKALELYINMLGGAIKGVDFSELEKTISNELQHLIVLHKPKIDYKRLPNDWLKAEFKIDIRMTLAWTSPDAHFEFQFVNPDNRFYTWSSENNMSNKGHQLLEEFIIDDATMGKWTVNVRYTGAPVSSSVAPYLKYTLYRNYGQPTEQKTVKLIKLDDQLDKATLDSFLK